MPVAAERAILGASVRTLDLARPWATAVAWRDGIVTAVGDDATVRAACDGATELIDGAGVHLTPGLIDSHFHPFWGTAATRGVDLTKVRSLDELRSALATERARIGPDDWVIGWGLTFEMFIPTGIRGDLFADAVGGGLAFLGFFDGHTAVASPAAVAYCDLTGRETFGDFSTVVTDEKGAPTGELREHGAIALVRDTMPQPTPAQLERWYVENMQKFNERGLTQVHAMLGRPETYELCARIEARGELSIRLIVPLHQPPETTLDEMRAQLHLRDVAGRRWRGGVAKFFMDGVAETGTAWLLAPDSKGEGTLPFWPDPAHYDAAVEIFAKAGFQCVTHAVGDGAVRHALDAYEAAGRTDEKRGLHRVEHIELLDDADLPRFAALGVGASMQPLHMVGFHADGSDEWSTRVGPERRRRAFRTRDLVESGATLSLGSDWMVAPYDPRIGMGFARLRREPGQPDRAPIEPRQALTAEETLAGYTTSAAAIVGESHLSGMIRAGYRADLSGFAEDIVAIDPDALLDVPTRLTIVDGEVVYQAER